MVYNQKLVASIKCNGKILREFKDTVYLPFGSEYSILLLNLNSVKAIVNITIDGDDIVPGGLVLYPNQEIDLQRSIKNNNLEKGNKFKFIERTGSIEEHRGVKLQDGLVRISYQFEKLPLTTNMPYQPNPIWGNNSYGVVAQDCDFSPSSALRRVDITNNTTIGTYCSVNNVSIAPASASVQPTNDVGITVPGSESNQKFSRTSDFAVESQKHTIVLKLLGETVDNKPVEQAITTKYKPECQTCGRKNKANAKFCTECGTSLNVI